MAGQSSLTGVRHLFEPCGGGHVPTILATGPWNRELQGGVALSALVAHAVERHPSPTEMVTTRLVVDIMKPTRMAAVETAVTVLREGRRLQLLQVEVVQDGTTTVRASVLRVRTAGSPSTDEPVHPLPPPGLPSLLHERSPLRRICETRLESGGLEIPGPGVVWARIDGEIVPGTRISPFVQLAMVADMGSGISSFVDWRERTYANVDISLHLARMPLGPWIRIAARTESAGNGLAVVTSRLADCEGELGHAHQTLFLDRRG